VIANIVGWQGLFTICDLVYLLNNDSPESITLEVIKEIAAWMDVFLNFFAGLVIGFAFYHLKKLTEEFKDFLVFGVNMVVAHAICYVLSTVSIVALAIAFLTKMP